MWEVFTDPIGCVMTRKMLLTLKQRVEQAPKVGQVSAQGQA
jgi:hypothetical protein